MGQKWIQMLVLLVFYQQITPGAAKDMVVKEGSSVDIRCKPEKGTLVFWFRVLDQSNMELIASLSPSGQIKKSRADFSQLFGHRNQGTEEYVLTLKSFKRSDRGIYNCGTLVGGNTLSFGEVTRLQEEKKQEPKTAAPTCTTRPTPPPTTSTCVCKDKLKKGPSGLSMSCAPIILGPLAGGCGLLLLLLIVVTVYCNKMRTRRCPHHYKRKPRMGVPDKMMSNI